MAGKIVVNTGQLHHITMQTRQIGLLKTSPDTGKRVLTAEIEIVPS